MDCDLVVLASVAPEALIPELFLILFFQRGRPHLRNLRNLAFTIPVWGFDGSTGRSSLSSGGDIGSVTLATFPVVLGKILIDQFGYNVFFAAPFGVLTYEWKNSGVSVEPVRDLFTWRHYRDKIIPTLLATWAVWIPLMAIVARYALYPVYAPLRAGPFIFWVLLLTYMTNRFAGKIETDIPMATATAR